MLESHQPLWLGGLRWQMVPIPFPPSLRGRVYPSPYPLPGVLVGSAAALRGVLERLFGHLGAFLFFITFSMPFWIDLCSIFDPNLPPQIHQNRSKIDAKMPSDVELLFRSIFYRFLLPTSTPESQLNASRLAFSWFSAFKVDIDF